MKRQFFQLWQTSGIVLALIGTVAVNRLGAAVLAVDVNSASLPANTQSGFDSLAAPVGPFPSTSGTFGGVNITITGIGEALNSFARTLPTNNSSTTRRS